MSDSGYLIDTNVISELGRRRPHAAVRAYVESLAGSMVFVSVLTLGELRKGAEMTRRSDPRHAGRIDEWIAEVEREYAERTLDVDTATAGMWGRLSATRPRPVVDTLLAATAIVHDLTLVTRNTRDVADTGAAFVNPWE